jgi:hypothetical protein
MTARPTRPTRAGGTRRAGRQIDNRARCPHAGAPRRRGTAIDFANPPTGQPKFFETEVRR